MSKRRNLISRPRFRDTLKNALDTVHGRGEEAGNLDEKKTRNFNNFPKMRRRRRHGAEQVTRNGGTLYNE